MVPGRVIDMTAAQAIEIAHRAAREQGRPIDGYSARGTLEGDVWRIEFLSEKEKPAPGEFFTVFIENGAGTVMRIVDGK